MIGGNPGAHVLNRAMHNLGMNARQLAKRSGVDASLISRYLSGESLIGVKNAPKLARALNVTAEQLLFGREGVAEIVAAPPPHRLSKEQKEYLREAHAHLGFALKATDARAFRGTLLLAVDQIMRAAFLMRGDE